MYFQAGGKLGVTAPADRSDEAFDDYVSDPAKPVPYTAEVTTTEGHLFMVEDQRFVWGRPDVLVYATDVLTQDVTLAGPVVPELFVSTTGTDAADFAITGPGWSGTLPSGIKAEYKAPTLMFAISSCRHVYSLLVLQAVQRSRHWARQEARS
jgi:hypothetical protein